MKGRACTHCCREDQNLEQCWENIWLCDDCKGNFGPVLWTLMERGVRFQFKQTEDDIMREKVAELESCGCEPDMRIETGGETGNNVEIAMKRLEEQTTAVHESVLALEKMLEVVLNNKDSLDSVKAEALDVTACKLSLDIDNQASNLESTCADVQDIMRRLDL